VLSRAFAEHDADDSGELDEAEFEVRGGARGGALLRLVASPAVRLPCAGSDRDTPRANANRAARGGCPICCSLTIPHEIAARGVGRAGRDRDRERERASPPCQGQGPHTKNTKNTNK
jgi:hypothetical protein